MIVATAVWMSLDTGLGTRGRLVLMTVGMPTLGLLMVSTIRYRSFKHIRLGVPARIALLVAMAGIIVLAWRTRASVVLLSAGIAYIIMGPAEWLVRRIRRRRRRSLENN